MKATLNDILTEEEKRAPALTISTPHVVLDMPIQTLTARQLAILFLVLKLKKYENRQSNGENLVCMVWNEIVARCIDKKIEIF